MKISPKQYAQSLYEIVSQTEDCDVVIKNFVKVLVARNQLGKAEKIIQEFIKIWNKEQGIVEGDLVSVRELDKDMIDKLNNSVAEVLGAKKVNLKNKVDKNILGGFVAQLGDIVIDGSVKNQLNNLKNKLVN